METVLEPLVLSPKLRLYLDELETIVQAEERNRQQFYEQLSEDRKMEFINGEILMHSPVKLSHNLASSRLFNLLNNYVSVQQLGFVGYEKILITLTRNDYEPDLCFFANPTARTLTPDQMKFPAPDFIAEVLSPSTEETDRTIKCTDYAAHGVREYWLIDPDAETVEQYVLQGEAYALRLKVRDGTLQSEVIEGLTIPVRAIFDEQANVRALRTILQETSEEV